MAGSQHERVLAAEWLVLMGVETMDALANSSGGKFKLPSPSRYFAAMVVFLMLAGVAMFGTKAGRLASAFGGVATLAIVAAPGAKGKTSPVLGALKYIDGLLKSPPTTLTSTLPPTPYANTPAPTASAAGPPGPNNPAEGKTTQGAFKTLTPKGLKLKS